MSAPRCQHCKEYHVPPIIVPAPVLSQPFAEYMVAA